MPRWLALLTLVACDAPAATAVPPPAPHVVYPAPAAAFPLAAPHGRIGRSQAPQPPPRLSIAGEGAPLHLATPWPVPGAGPARAVVYGLDRDRPAVELIEIDAGRVVWRDEVGCAAPVVGVTADAIVCADAHGTRAIGLDGKPRWKGDATFIAITGDHVVTAGAGEAAILDAASGDEVARVTLPPKVTSDSIVASCGDAGRELFAVGQDGKLVRIAEAKGGPKIVWSVLVGNVAAVDACDAQSVLVTANTPAGTALIAIARDTGKLTGRIDGVRGSWPARDGSDLLEISTVGGVAKWPRDLIAPQGAVDLPVLGELLGKRDDRRLVRATPLTAALLDRHGVRAYLPLAELGAVLGDDTILAASWLGSPGETVHRIGVPHPWPRALRLPLRGPGVALPAELRDLPAPAQLDLASAAGREGAALRSVAAAALDRDALYAVALDKDPDDSAAAGLARYELALGAWTWLRGDGCGAGMPLALATTDDIVACAARGKTASSVRATAGDGTPRWSWQSDNVDAIDADAGLVLVRDADRLAVLDASDGRALATLSSDDGAAMRATALEIDGMPLLVTYERGQIVARLPRVQMLPAWSLAVDGVVHGIAASGDGVLVDLEDGDAYRLDARTGAAVALPGLGGVWRASGELVTQEVPGEPVPPAAMPVPPPVIKKPVPLHDTPENPPAIATPWVVPPPGPAAWQYTLFELDGSLRVRNDYALEPPVAPAAARGPAGSPLVVTSGPGGRQALVIDPRTGDPLRRVQLPEQAGPVFSTIVDGKPIAGTILAAPLRVVRF